MKILILGGDGFCGWPTALHLSNLGHDVAIVDNLSPVCCAKCSYTDASKCNVSLISQSWVQFSVNP